jgi:hypothetical protein
MTAAARLSLVATAQGSSSQRQHQVVLQKKIENMMLMVLKRRATKAMTYPHPCWQMFNTYFTWCFSKGEEDIEMVL